MNKRVYLVNVSRTTRTIHFPIGLGQIAKALECAGILFEVIDLVPIPYQNRFSSFSRMVESIDKPALFGFSIIAGNGQIVEVDRCARLVKEADPRHIVVYGGPLPSAIPRLCIEKSAADYVFIGEGEESFPEFLSRLDTQDLDGISGIAYRDRYGAIHVTGRKRVRDLDRYSPPPYRRFDMDFYNGYLKETSRCFEISGSRGCRGSCTFCFRFSGGGLTARSGNSIFEEVEFVYKKFGIERFNFTDENFLQEKGSFYGFLELLEKSGIAIKFRGQTRVDEIDEAFCVRLAKNGLISINFGVESADDDILGKIAKRISVKEMEEKIQLLRSHGVDVYTSLIIGFPWETIDSLKAAKDFILRNKLQGRCSVNYLAPLPATALFQQAKKAGLIQDEWQYVWNIGYLYQDTSVNMTSLDQSEVLRHFEELRAIGEPKTPYPGGAYEDILMDESVFYAKN